MPFESGSGTRQDSGTRVSNKAEKWHITWFVFLFPHGKYRIGLQDHQTLSETYAPIP